MPHELSLFGVFIPPILPVLILSVIAMIFTAWLLNRFRLSRFFVYPQLVALAFVVIYMCIFSTFLIRI